MLRNFFKIFRSMVYVHEIFLKNLSQSLVGIIEIIVIGITYHPAGVFQAVALLT